MRVIRARGPRALPVARTPPAAPRGGLSRLVDSPGPLMAVVAAAYGAGALCSWVLLKASTTAVFFPPAGVTLAALLLVDRRRWVWVLSAAGGAELAVNLSQGQRPAVACGFVLANLVEPLVGATTVRRWRPGRLRLGRRSDAMVFVVGAVLVGPLVGAAVGASTIAVSRDTSWLSAFGSFWAGDALAVLTLGTALVAAAPLWSGSTTSARRSGPLGRAAVLVATAAVTAAGFWPREVPLAFLPLPLLMVVALQGSVTLVAAAGFVMALTANLVSGAGRGPWASLATEPRPTAATLQLYLAVSVLAAWLLTVEIRARDHAQELARREAVARQRLQALQRVTTDLAAAVTSEQIAQVLSDDAVTLVADYGVVGLIDHQTRTMQTWTTVNVPADVADPLARISLSEADAFPITHAAVTGQVITLPSLDDIRHRYPAVEWTHRGTGTRSLFVVPVVSGQRSLGALAYGFATEGPPDPDLVLLAQAVANAAGQAWERARLYDVEHDASHRLQRSLLPRIPTDLPGTEVAVHYRPAETSHDVGGDWYDAFELPGDRVALVVGDVVGHDLSAAIVMGQLQVRLRALAPLHGDPGRTLDALDQVAATIPGAEGATIGLAIFDPSVGSLDYACAGHPPPLLVTPARTGYLWGARSLPLALATVPRPHATVTLTGESILIWYSDGLIERRHESLDTGLDQLCALATTLVVGTPSHGLAGWCQDITAALTSGYVLEDDLVITCARLRPGGGANLGAATRG